MNKTLKYGIVSLFLLVMMTFAIAGDTLKVEKIDINKDITVSDATIANAELDGKTVGDYLFDKGVSANENEQRNKIINEYIENTQLARKFGTVEQMQQVTDLIKSFNITEDK